MLVFSRNNYPLSPTVLINLITCKILKVIRSFFLITCVDIIIL